LPVKVITDSTSDIPPQLAQELGIGVVPLSVIFGDEVYKENRDITTDLFYDKLVHAKALPTTSAPSVGDFLEAYQEALKETDEILSIHISSKLSATYNNACQAAAQLADQGARIEVVDSLSVSFGMIFMATAAAKAAAGGATLDELRKMMDSMVPRLHIYVALDTLEYVRRGGRIGRARAFLGTVLRVKPLLSIHDGEVHPEERVRSRRLILDRLFQIVTSFANVAEVGVAYSTNAQEAEEMMRRLREALPAAHVQMARLGPVIGVHGGPGVLGVGVLEGEE
jgi:DegV family protein with EDD domain